MKFHADTLLRPTLSRLLLLAILLPGCMVSRQRHDQVLQRYHSEVSGRARSERQLADTRLRAEHAERALAEALERLSRQDSVLEHAQQSLAQSQFDVALKEREGVEANEIVVQLRSELGRMAEHLQSYATQREALTQQQADLGEELRLAEMRLSAAERTSERREAALRNILLQMHKEVQSSVVRVDRVGPDLVVHMKSKDLFPSGGQRLTKGGRTLLSRIAASLLDSKARIQLVERPAAARPLQAKRFRAAVQALSAAGLDPSRLSFDAHQGASTRAETSKKLPRFGLRVSFEEPELEPQARSSVALEGGNRPSTIDR